jgi:hypothetical protein
VNVDQSLAELFDPGEPRQSSPVCLPPMVNQETLLGQLSSETLDSRYIIVTDDCAVYIDRFDGPSTHRTIEAGVQTTLSSLRSESFGGSRFGATL